LAKLDMHDASQPVRLGVVILAAGASVRMGKPKLLLRWRDRTIVSHLIRQWLRLGAEQVGLVCAASNDALHRELDRLEFQVEGRIINPVPEQGMFSSIRCAAKWHNWKPSLTHWAFSLGDQPQVRDQTFRTLLDFVHDHPERICQPSRDGRARHPVIFPAAHFTALADASEENLKQFLEHRRGELAWCEIEDPGLDLDIDTPEDYERALNLETAVDRG
jgi:molybdenum cofactor cytidylyltransferase